MEKVSTEENIEQNVITTGGALASEFYDRLFRFTWNILNLAIRWHYGAYTLLRENLSNNGY